MIRALRRRHRWMFFLLALIIPALLAAALWLRRPLPRPTHESLLQPIDAEVAPEVED